MYPPTPIAKMASRQDKDWFCEFYGTHSHTTAQCRDLKNQVKDLVRNHYLDEFINGAIPIADSSCGAEKSARNAGHE